MHAAATQHRTAPGLHAGARYRGSRGRRAFMTWPLSGSKGEDPSMAARSLSLVCRMCSRLGDGVKCNGLPNAGRGPCNFVVTGGLAFRPPVQHRAPTASIEFPEADCPTLVHLALIFRHAVSTLEK